MKRLVATARLSCLFGVLCLFAVSCGGSDEIDPLAAAGDLTSCSASDPECATVDAGGKGDLPDVVSLADPNDPNAPLQVSFGGFFYSDGTVSQLCSSLAESFPPQCGSVVINLEASLDVVLENVAASFGNPDDAKVNIDQGIYWTDDWINLTGALQANRLVLE